MHCLKLSRHHVSPCSLGNTVESKILEARTQQANNNTHRTQVLFFRLLLTKLRREKYDGSSEELKRIPKGMEGKADKQENVGQTNEKDGRKENDKFNSVFHCAT